MSAVHKGRLSVFDLDVNSGLLSSLLKDEQIASKRASLESMQAHLEDPLMH